MFGGPLPAYMSSGVAGTFISSAVLAIMIALGSSLPFAIAGVDSSTAAVTAILASSVVERMAATDPTAPLLAPVLMTLALSAIITGIVLCGFGVTRMGRAIRYVPYPVVGGFLGATGCLLVLGAVRVITGQRLEFAALYRFANLLTVSELAAACAMALVLYRTWPRSPTTIGIAGAPGCIEVSRAMINLNSGGTGRLSGLTVAAVSALMLAVAPMLLGYMPKFVLGGLLIYLGADQLHKWIVESRRRLSKTEYLSLLAIIVIIVQWGFVAGVLIGVVIGCATFALSASRIDSIKFSFARSEYRSSLDRSRDDEAVLAAHGGKIHGLKLHSYLFFRSANRLYHQVKALLARRPQCRLLAFAFTLVPPLHSPPAHNFP